MDARKPSSRWFGVAVAGMIIVAACSAGTRVRAVKRAAIPTTTQATIAPPAPATFPLTGLPVDDKGRAARPALSVKVDNAPRRLSPGRAE